jgi:hypothetical protein
MTAVTWTPRVYRVAQRFGQRRVGALSRLHDEGHNAADDNGPIAAE